MARWFRLAYRFPALSFAGASLAEPCFRFHFPLIEPDVRISRIRLSDWIPRRHTMRTAHLRLTGKPLSRAADRIEVARPKANRSIIALSLGAPELRSLRSTDVTPLRRYYGPLRHPARPSLLLTEILLRVTRSHRWGFPCCAWFPVSTCRRQYPGGTLGCTSLTSPRTAAFPALKPGRLPQQSFRGLLGVHSRSGLPTRGVA